MATQQQEVTKQIKTAVIHNNVKIENFTITCPKNRISDDIVLYDAKQLLKEVVQVFVVMLFFSCSSTQVPWVVLALTSLECEIKRHYQTCGK
jgi:glucan phosphoethanolaminetransferase (alkaline phosphatase superfamily)